MAHLHLSTTITWRWNPLQAVSHNETRMARVLDHAAHIAVGALAGLAGLTFPAPTLAAVGYALLTAFTCKCLWIDWHRSSGQLVHLSTFATALDDHTPGASYTIDGPHWLSDFGLALLGALCVVHVRSWQGAPVALLAYYALSTFNGV